MPHQRTAIFGRRKVLAGFAGGAAAVLFGSTAHARDDAPSETATPTLVWRLDSHWGYPVGGSAKTHCECRACVLHARNKVFATRDAAEKGRAHTGCVCQFRAVEINADYREKLFGGSDATVVDMRSPDVAEIYAAAMVSTRG